MNRQTLQGKAALVTGASHGIGLGCARALVRDGAAVVLMGRREEALARARETLLDEFPAARIEVYAGDAVDEAALKGALAAARGLEGRLDILVGVVGGPVYKPLLMRELSDVRQELDLNFSSQFLLIRHGAPLLEQGGSIVCISTIAVTQPAWGLAVYGAAKAALERLVRGAAFELAEAGIRVNAVRPGATLSAEDLASPASAALMQPYIAETPLGRSGNPDDIGLVVRFLAGPESGWVTGQTFAADGGLEQGKSPDHMDEFFGKEVMDRIRAGKPANP